LFNKEIIPALPYTRPRTKEGFFRKQDYVYDEHFDCYLCPSGENSKGISKGVQNFLIPNPFCLQTESGS
ncbi:hypothetical protein ACE8FZ_27090, partial [Peribacillus frigoritolerans]